MKKYLFLFVLMILYGAAWSQTVSVYATGTPGSYKTGSVNSAGTKNDGNLVAITTSTNRGWAVFDLSAVPVGATITSANIIFTTFSSTLSSATNSIRGLTGDPATMPGATLYNNLNTGAVFTTISWPAAATTTTAVAATGITFLQANIGNPILVGFVRGSTNSYNIYGYPGTTAQQPRLDINYTLPPCAGQPSAGTINAPASVCPNVNFTMTLSGASVGGSMTYQWQSKPAASGTFTNIVSATGASYTTSITAPTSYRLFIKCGNSGLTDISAPVTVNVNSFYVCYCNTSLGGGSGGASIDSVSIVQTTLKKASPGTAPGSYSQYPATGNTTADIQAGGLYYLYVKYGADAIGSAWLDMNRNGLYEASEWMRINNSGTVGLAVVQIPGTALPGLTGMRIRSADASSTNGAANACTPFTSGETEDYVVNIIPAPTNDLRVVTYLSPSEPEGCPYKDLTVKAVIYNNGTSAQSGFPVITDIKGPISNTYTYMYTGTLASFKTDTLTLATIRPVVSGIYDFSTRIYIANDANNANDTFRYAVSVQPGGNSVIIRNDSACIGEEAMLHVLPDGSYHNWYKNPDYTGLVYTKDTMKIPNIQKDSLLYVCTTVQNFTSNSLTTSSGGGNGCGGGAMFNIVPTLNLTVDSFAALFGTTGTQTVNVYYRTGTYLGSETTSGAWTLLGTTNVNVTSTTALTRFSVNIPLNLSAATTYGIYLNYDASYTNGTTTYSNADMSIETGAGLCSQFGGVNAGRMFNGTVFYHTGMKGCEGPLTPIAAYAGPKPLVNLGADLKPCDDQEVILDPGYPGGTYLWNTGETSQSIKVKNKSGTYWVEVDKYCKSSDTMSIIVQPTPTVAGISYTHIGNTFTFDAAGVQNANRWLWIFGDGGTDVTSLNPRHVYNTSGSYKVLLVLYNDCGADTTALTIPLGISNTTVSDDRIVLYPNPANNHLTIEYKNIDKVSSVVIVNTMGTVVYKQYEVAKGKIETDISHLPAGNYIVRLSCENEIISKPFAISR